MAMVEASQRSTEMELDDDDEDDDDEDDDDEGHPHHRAFEEEMEDINESDDDELDDDDDDGSMYSGDINMVMMYAPEQQQQPNNEESISHAGSEELDAFEQDLDNPMAALSEQYQWNDLRSASAAVLEDSVVSEFQMSSTSTSDNNHIHDSSQPLSNMELLTTTTTPTTTHIDAAMMIRRTSFGEPALRRSSQAESSTSEISFNSAPARAGQEPTTSPYNAQEGADGQRHQRPLSIAVPNAAGAENSRRSSNRRSSVQIKSEPFTHNPTKHNSWTTASSVGGGGGGSSRFLNSFVGKRRSRRRQNLSLPGDGYNNSSGAITGSQNNNNNSNLANAIASLRNQDSNSEWENVAAAAAVVAASSQIGGMNSKATGMLRHIQFAVQDTVLVFLTLLNVTNKEDPKDTFTVAPVNKYGYPSGEGTTELEKNGPYTFVLATVKHVHFDEDDRYYTIVRSDTGTEQRADSGE
jgi:hypothetical protein